MSENEEDLRLNAARVFALSRCIETQATLEDVPRLFVECVQSGAWRHYRYADQSEVIYGDTPFDFIRFIRNPPPQGLGTTEKMLRNLFRDHPDAQALLEQKTQGKHGGDRKSEDIKFDNVQLDISNNPPTGNSSARALRKLRSAAPELHARVLAGELSPHAAMVEAGYRKRMYQIPADAEDAAIVLLKKFNADELQQIVEIIANHIAVDA